MMEFLTVAGFFLSAIGVIFAIYALVQAGGAKEAVAQLLNKSNEQVTRDDSLDLLNKLNAAKSAAINRRGKPARGALAGRNLKKDVDDLKQAQDALATITVSTDATLEGELRLAATQLDEALKEIEVTRQRDGWADALGVIQGLIPKVTTHQRKLSANALV